MSISRLYLLFETTRHLALRQLITRVWQSSRRVVYRYTAAEAKYLLGWRLGDLQAVWGDFCVLRNNEEIKLDLRRIEASADETHARHFNFLGCSVAFEDSLGWHDPRLSRLWRYHLHYFNFARELVITDATRGGRQWWETFKQLVLDWQKNNRRLTGDGWHPYTISLRLANWLHVWSVWRTKFEEDADFRDVFHSSIYFQARFLRSMVEFDVRGNHLLENLRGLLWAGLAYEGSEPDSWVQFAMEVLRRETSEQILADGAHFERTPGYHVVVLQDYLEIAALLTANKKPVPDWLHDTMRAQAMYLARILGPGGRLPLLKDTAWDAAPCPSDLLNRVGGWLNEPGLKTSAPISVETALVLGKRRLRNLESWSATRPTNSAVHLEAAGLIVAQSRDGEGLVIDVGRPCPDYLPAHAHADSLNFEYQFAGQAIVVDSGVYEYAAGAWRDYFRSTRAHNTLELADRDSSEVWSSFRVGRRARTKVLSLRCGPGKVEALMQHDGYRYLPGTPLHQRLVVWEEGQYLVIFDRVLEGVSISAQSHLHLHPSVAVAQEGPRVWALAWDKGRLWVKGWLCGAVHASLGQEVPRLQGWYSERFGEKVSNQVLSFCPPESVPAAVGYLISPHRDLDCKLEQIADKWTLIVTLSPSRQDRFELSDSSVRRVHD